MEPGGRFLATGATVDTLLRFAYKLKPHQVAGAPAWITSEHFDIEAKALGNPSIEEMRPIVQAMLADRFKLAVHHETRQLPEYVLVLAKEGKLGPKLVPHLAGSSCVEISPGRPAQPRPGATPQIPCGGFFMSGGHMAATKTTAGDLAEMLGNFVDRLVVDRTGLTGTYDVDFDFTPVGASLLQGPGGTGPAVPDASAPALIFTAVQEQLGLKLRPETAPADVLVIDRVEQPSPN
jgi:uncharacterized protein (TIGR03435 family)